MFRIAMFKIKMFFVSMLLKVTIIALYRIVNSLNVLEKNTIKRVMYIPPKRLKNRRWVCTTMVYL